MSKLGYCSRNAAGAVIAAGRVRVDGSRKTNPGLWVDMSAQKITVDGAEVEVNRFRCIAFNKPPGCVTTRSDERGRKTVFDLLGAEANGLIAAGRLDLDTGGLLILTNDHRLADRLTSPATAVEKRYRFTTETPMTDAQWKFLAAGVEIKVNGKALWTRPAQLAAGPRGSVDLTITEGKNRQVRKMVEAVGNQVKTLTRLSVGPVALGDLKPGAWRDVTKQETAALRALILPRTEHADGGR